MHYGFNCNSRKKKLLKSKHLSVKLLQKVFAHVLKQTADPIY